MRLEPLQPLPVQAAPRAASRGTFFPVVSVCLLALVVAGFHDTLFFPSDEAKPMLPRLAVHGIAVTAWFVLLLVQSLLVAGRRVALHRRMGWVAAVVVVAVVLTSLQTIFGIVDSWRGQGVDVDARRALIGLIVWGDLGALLAFGVLFGRAMWLRRVRESHRRLMLLASFSIISPALIRLAGLPVFAGIDGVLLTLFGLLALCAVLVIHDLATLRRVHRATAWGVPFFLVVHLAPAFLLPGTALDTWVLARMW